MECTLTLTLLIFSYAMAGVITLYGISQLLINIFMFSMYYESDAHTKNSLKCFDEIGQYHLFWNMSVALPIIYITMSVFLILALVYKKSKFLSIWLVFWLFLICLDLAIHVGFYMYHCSPREAGILTIIAILICVVAMLATMLVCGLWWRWVRLASQPLGVSTYMEELAGKRWRYMLGLPDPATEAGTTQTSYTFPDSSDADWLVKFVPLDRDEIQIIERSRSAT